jgi:preprotein translocase subunit SecF
MIQFIKNRNIAFVFSGMLFVISVLSLAVFGLKLGIDFTGGSLIELSFSKERPQNSEIIQALQPVNLGEVIVQPTKDKNVIIKTRFISENEHQQILSAIREKFEIKQIQNSENTKKAQPNIVIEGENVSGIKIVTDKDEIVPENQVLEQRVETIGPAISSDLKSRTMKAIVVVNILIIAYIAYTFRRVSKPVQSWKYGVIAVVALIHDIVITVGIFSLLGRFWGIEVNIPFVVALLTILGYSVNDTIIIFDRTRENLIRTGRDNFDQTVNAGLNQTLWRSINTTLTTLLTLFALFLFGGESIKYFSLTLLIGIFFGAYSSIFLASPLLVVWERFMNRKYS